MSTILRTRTRLPPATAQLSELDWKHEHAQLAARQRKRTQRNAKRAAPRVPDFLHHLPASTCEALMQSADHIDVFEKAKAQSNCVTQSNRARILASGSSSNAHHVESIGSKCGRRRASGDLSRSRQSHNLNSQSAPDLGTTAGTAEVRTSRGSVGDFEIRPYGSDDAHQQRAIARESKAEQRRQRRQHREALQQARKDSALVGLPPILPIAGGSMTFTVGASGKAGTAELVGREATELADLGGLISPSAIDKFDFSTEFMTPEMTEEKQQRRARLRKAIGTARMSVSMHKSTRDKQQSQALHSFLGGMKSRTRVKSLVNRHVRDENRRLFANEVA